MTRCHLRFLAAAALFLLTAHAQSSVHVSQSKGDVTIRRPDGTLLPAAANSPLAAGDRLITGSKGQADIALDDAHVFRASANTEVQLVEADPAHYRVTLLRGAIDWTVSRTSSTLVEVETPSVEVRPAHQGQYSIGLDRTLRSVVVARSGAVEVGAPAGSEWINTGQKMLARGPADNPEYKIGPAVPLWKRIAILGMNVAEVTNAIATAIPAGSNEPAPAHAAASTARTAPPPSSTPTPRTGPGVKGH